MKLVFLDTEFTGEHAYTTLVSIGLVNLENQSIYYTLNDYDKTQVSHWLKDNVLSQIDETLSISGKEAIENIDLWLRNYSQGEKIILVSFGKTSDMILLFQLWVHIKKDNNPFHFLYHLPNFLNHSDHIDFCTLLSVSNVPISGFNKEEYAKSTEFGKKHNALYDAKILRSCFIRLLLESENLNNLRLSIGLSLFHDICFVEETNLEFEQKNLPENKDINEITNQFLNDNIIQVNEILKKSIDSKIYRLKTKDGKFYILRSFPIEFSQIVEVQSQILNKISFKDIIKPLQNKIDNKLVLKQNSNGYIVYPYIEGYVFQGEKDQILNILNATLQLFESLKSIQYDSNLKQVEYSDWDLNLMSIWFDKNIFLTKLKSILHPLIFNFVDLNYQIIVDDLHEILNHRDLFKSDFVVHGDLNHSNILISNGSISFLDIEDLSFSSSGISLVHCIFKLYRHSIFMKKMDLTEFKLKYKLNLDAFLEKNNLPISSSKSFHFWGIAKIYFDLMTITSFYFFQNDNRYLYDMNKKISNLIEFTRMFA
jgi:DNA polymerase III epsilon subunit-like protein